MKLYRASKINLVCYKRLNYSGLGYIYNLPLTALYLYATNIYLYMIQINIDYLFCIFRLET